MSTHIIGFYEDLTKFIFELSSNIIKYAPYSSGAEHNNSSICKHCRSTWESSYWAVSSGNSVCFLIQHNTDLTDFLQAQFFFVLIQFKDFSFQDYFTHIETSQSAWTYSSLSGEMIEWLRALKFSDLTHLATGAAQTQFWGLLSLRFKGLFNLIRKPVFTSCKHVRVMNTPLHPTFI